MTLRRHHARSFCIYAIIGNRPHLVAVCTIAIMYTAPLPSTVIAILLSASLAARAALREYTDQGLYATYDQTQQQQ